MERNSRNLEERLPEMKFQLFGLRESNWFEVRRPGSAMPVYFLASDWEINQGGANIAGCLQMRLC